MKPIIGVTMNHFMSVSGPEFDNVGFSRSQWTTGADEYANSVEKAGGLISPNPNATTEPTTTGSTYTVKKGDCLWHIAEVLTGKGWKYKALFKANQDKIADPDLIYEGQVLILPW